MDPLFLIRSLLVILLGLPCVIDDQSFFSLFFQVFSWDFNIFDYDVPKYLSLCTLSWLESVKLLGHVD